jgi:hypothetical protein
MTTTQSFVSIIFVPILASSDAAHIAIDTAINNNRKYPFQM